MFDVCKDSQKEGKYVKKYCSHAITQQQQLVVVCVVRAETGQPCIYLTITNNTRRQAQQYLQLCRKMQRAHNDWQQYLILISYVATAVLL